MKKLLFALLILLFSGSAFANLTVTVDSSNPDSTIHIANTDGNTLTSVQIAASTDNIDIIDVTFQNIGALDAGEETKSTDRTELLHLKVDGVIVASAAPIAGIVDFSGIGVTVYQNSQVTMELVADFYAIDNAAKTGSIHKYEITHIEAQFDATGFALVDAELSGVEAEGDPVDEVTTGNEHIVTKTLPILSSVDPISGDLTNGVKEIAGVKIIASSTGTVSVYALRFEVTSTGSAEFASSGATIVNSSGTDLDYDCGLSVDVGAGETQTVECIYDGVGTVESISASSSKTVYLKGSVTGVDGIGDSLSIQMIEEGPDFDADGVGSRVHTAATVDANRPYSIVWSDVSNGNTQDTATAQWFGDYTLQNFNDLFVCNEVDSGCGSGPDNTAPTLTTVTIASDNADPTKAMLGDTITLTITSDEDLRSTPTVTIAGKSAVESGSGTSWTASYTLVGTEANGATAFTINGEDLNGNTLSQVTSTTDASSVDIDLNMPTLTFVSIASNNADTTKAMQGDTITLDFESDEDLAATPVVTIASKSATVTGSGTTWSASYTLTATETQGSVGFTINGEDLSANPMNEVNVVTDASFVDIDTEAPTLTQTTAVGALTSGHTADQTPDWVFNTNEDGDFVLEGTCGTQTGASVSSGNVTVTFDSDGSGGNLGEATYSDCGVRLTDATGNESSLLTASSFTVDITAPTLSSVSIISDNADTTKAKEGDTITITFTSDEDLATTPTVTIAGKSATVTGGPINWSASYTLTATETQGNTAITIDGFDLTEVNALTQVTTTSDASSVTVDTVLPILTEVGIVGASSYNYTTDTTPDWVFQSDEDGVFTIGGTCLTATPTSVTGGVDKTVTLDSNGASNPLPEGEYDDCTVYVTDATGNQSATRNISDFTVDTTDPNISTVSIASDNINNTSVATTGDTITLTFTSDEDLAATPTVTLAGKSAAVTGSGTSWSATYMLTASETQGNAAITIDGYDLTETNALTQVTATTDASGVVIDQAAPTLSTVSIASDNADNRYAKLGDTITVTFESSESLQATPTVTVATKSATVTGGPTNWSASWVVDGTETQSVAAISINANDVGGNPLTQVTDTTDSSYVRIDYSQPILQSFTTSTSGTNGPTTDIIISANYDEDINTGSVTVDLNNTITGLVLSCPGGTDACSGTYTVGATGSGEDIIGLDVTAIVSELVSDNASNLRSDSVMPATTLIDGGGVDIDVTAPTLPTIHIESDFSSDRTYALQGNVVSLSFVGDEALEVSPIATLTGISGCDTIVDTSDPARTNWNIDCTISSGSTEGVVGFIIDYVDDYGNSGTTATSTTDASYVEIEIYGAGGGGGSGVDGEEIQTHAQKLEAAQTAKKKEEQEKAKAEKIKDQEEKAAEEKPQEELKEQEMEAEKTEEEQVEQPKKEVPVMVEKPICTNEDMNICSRTGDSFMSFHKHLACAGVVAPENDCIGAKCERRSIRKEVVAMSVKLGRHELMSPAKYRYHFTDIDYSVGGWVPGVVETSLGLGIISGTKDEFRPDREVSRAEAYSMLMKGVCMPLERVSGDWKENVFATAQKHKITSRSSQNFNPNNTVTRQELFVVASRLLDYVNETGGCYKKLSCEK